MDIASNLHTKTLTIESGKDAFSSELIATLEQFTKQHYLVENSNEFAHHVLNIDKPGELALFYDENDKLIGFSRFSRQIMTINGKEITVFLGGTYHNQRYNLHYTAVKVGLIQAMKYKLAHPEQEMVFFSNANTPVKYQFLANMNEDYYPRQGIRTPDHVLKLLQGLKKQHNWVSPADNPMVISGQMPVLHPSTHPQIEATELTEYYLSLNPDYKAGHTLLMYLPLNLATISLGIKKVVSHAI